MLSLDGEYGGMDYSTRRKSLSIENAFTNNRHNSRGILISDDRGSNQASISLLSLSLSHHLRTLFRETKFHSSLKIIDIAFSLDFAISVVFFE